MYIHASFPFWFVPNAFSILPQDFLLPEWVFVAHFSVQKALNLQRIDYNLLLHWHRSNVAHDCILKCATDCKFLIIGQTHAVIFVEVCVAHRFSCLQISMATYLSNKHPFRIVSFTLLIIVIPFIHFFRSRKLFLELFS